MNFNKRLYLTQHIQEVTNSICNQYTWWAVVRSFSLAKSLKPCVHFALPALLNLCLLRFKCSRATCDLWLPYWRPYKNPCGFHILLPSVHCEVWRRSLSQVVFVGCQISTAGVYHPALDRTCSRNRQEGRGWSYQEVTYTGPHEFYKGLCMCSIIWPSSKGGCGVIICILQRVKQRHRDCHELSAQRHKDSKWWTWDLNPGGLDPRLVP